MPNPVPVAIPELANLPTPQPAPKPSAEAPAETAAAEATPPQPAAPSEGSDAPVTAQGPAAPPGLPALNVAAPPTSLPGLNIPPPPARVGMATSLPEIDVEGPAKTKMGGRTWKSTLAPAIVPKQTTFNYRRQILPDVIYRKQYDRENTHLPIAVTREDYAQLLIARVAANDLDGTRALLNTGLPVNTVDGYGQTLLNVARRAGARDTERLLIARGAS